MAKSKYAPALYEKIGNRLHRDRDKLAVPPWCRPTPTTPGVPGPPADEVEPLASSRERESPPGTFAIEPASDPGPYPPTAEHPCSDRSIESVGRPPIWQLGNGRIEISLSPVHAAVVAGVLLLAVYASYLVGRHAGSGSGPETSGGQVASDDVEALLRQPTKPSVLGVTGDPTGPAQRPTPAREGTAAVDRSRSPKPEPDPDAAETTPGKREPGINYVVIETFKPEHKNAAEHVQAWLAGNYGLDTNIEKSGSSWRLVTTKGFDFRQAGQEAACEKFRDDVRSLGSACAKELSGKGLPIYLLKAPQVQRFDR